MKASRGSSRGSIAVIARPSGSTAGRSFIEWTAMSIEPASSASSISLVNSPLPPISASDRLRSRSPVVEIGTMATASGSSRCALTNASRAAPAWIRASGDPRVPILKTGAGNTVDPMLDPLRSDRAYPQGSGG